MLFIKITLERLLIQGITCVFKAEFLMSCRHSQHVTPVSKKQLLTGRLRARPNACLCAGPDLLFVARVLSGPSALIDWQQQHELLMMTDANNS